MVTAHRGELWTLAGGGRISSKPRPALIMQSDLFSGSDYVTVALLTHQAVDSPVRVALPTTETTGLTMPSHIMADKLHTIPRTSLGKRIGAVPTAVMTDVERAILVYLGVTA